MKIMFLDHALSEMKKRAITRSMVEHSINSYGSKIEQTTGRMIYQRIYNDKELKKEMLLRVITESSNDDILVITTYKTSNIKKYLRS